jgi:hypothetical protein
MKRAKDFPHKNRTSEIQPSGLAEDGKKNFNLFDPLLDFVPKMFGSLEGDHSFQESLSPLRLCI